MSEVPLSYSLQSAASDVSNVLEKWMHTLDADHSEWVVVDGEEGDHGAIHYSENGQRICTKKSKGGDDDWLEMTEYGARRALEIIREHWEPTLLNTIKTYEGIELQ